VLSPERCDTSTEPACDRRSLARPAHIPLLTPPTTLHPAQIPQEVAGSSRRDPAIPQRQCRKALLSPGNPRPLPLNPEPPRPACHAGGRGFESRRSSKLPAKPHLLLSALAQTTAGFDPFRSHPAREPPHAADQSRRFPQPWFRPLGRRSMLTTGIEKRLCRSLSRKGNGLASVGEPVAASISRVCSSTRVRARPPSRPRRPRRPRV
jgi:hypothetical protein